MSLVIEWPIKEYKISCIGKYNKNIVIIYFKLYKKKKKKQLADKAKYSCSKQNACHNLTINTIESGLINKLKCYLFRFVYFFIYKSHLKIK